jgi:hypothetical protein
MSKINRVLLWGVAAALVLTALSALAWHEWILQSRANEGVEVAVFLGNEANELEWERFISAIKQEVKQNPKLHWEEPKEGPKKRKECVVSLGDARVVFRWYPSDGRSELQENVRRVCQRDKPPLAIVGAENSFLTTAVVKTLVKEHDKRKEHDKSPNTPISLMTGATEDNLVDTYKGLSFRFSFRNSYQARMVLDRWKEKLVPQNPQVRAVVVQVQDNPYSQDLAHQFSQELRARAIRGISEGKEFMLPTSPAGYAPPSNEEINLAKKIVRLIKEHQVALRASTVGSLGSPFSQGPVLAVSALFPQRTQWLLVLPLDTSGFRRLATALDRELDSELQTRGQLTILTGDWLDYYTFTGDKEDRLSPQETPAPVVFFAHDYPLGRDNQPDVNVPLVTRYRRVVKTLLTGLSELPATKWTADDLAGALHNTDLFDEDGNREEKNDEDRGGAIIATPEGDTFDFDLPQKWKSMRNEVKMLR